MTNAEATWVEAFHAFMRRWDDVGRENEASETEKYLGHRPFPAFVFVEQATTWEDIERWRSGLYESWCYRGQRDAEWALETSLDRAVRVHYEHEHGSGSQPLPREAESRELLKRFQSEVRPHLSTAPPIDDLVSWLALMQHHRVPTKLIDWTLSSDVALYFAVEETHEGPSAVWGLDLAWLDARARTILGEIGPRVVEPVDLLRDLELSVIQRVQPKTPNERMRVQDGVLLFNGRDGATFSQMLMRMMKHPALVERPVLRKLVIAGELRVECLERLHAKGVNAAALFPGVDGVGRTLRHFLEIRVEQERRRLVAEADALFAEGWARRR